MTRSVTYLGTHAGSSAPVDAAIAMISPGESDLAFLLLLCVLALAVSDAAAMPTLAEEDDEAEAACFNPLLPAAADAACAQQTSTRTTPASSLQPLLLPARMVLPPLCTSVQCTHRLVGVLLLVLLLSMVDGPCRGIKRTFYNHHIIKTTRFRAELLESECTAYCGPGPEMGQF